MYRILRQIIQLYRKLFKMRFFEHLFSCAYCSIWKDKISTAIARRAVSQNVVAMGYSWLLRQTLWCRLTWLSVIKYFWRGCLVPPRPGGNFPLPPSYATVIDVCVCPMQYSPRMCQCDKVSCVHYSRLHWRSGVPSLLPLSAVPSSSSSSLGIHLQRRHFHIAVFVLRTRDKSCTKYQEKVLAKQKLTRRLHFTACCTTGCIQPVVLPAQSVYALWVCDIAHQRRLSFRRQLLNVRSTADVHILRLESWKCIWKF